MPTTAAVARAVAPQLFRLSFKAGPNLAATLVGPATFWAGVGVGAVGICVVAGAIYFARRRRRLALIQAV